MKRKRLIEVTPRFLMVALVAQLLLVTTGARADPMSVISNLNQAFVELADKIIPAVVLINVVRGG